MHRDRPSRFGLWLMKSWQSTVVVGIEKDIVYFTSERGSSLSLAPVFYVQESGRIVGVGEYAGSLQGVRTRGFLNDLDRSSDSYGDLVRFFQFGIQQCIGRSIYVRPHVIVELAIQVGDESLFLDAAYAADAGQAEVRCSASDELKTR